MSSGLVKEARHVTSVIGISLGKTGERDSRCDSARKPATFKDFSLVMSLEVRTGLEADVRRLAL